MKRVFNGASFDQALSQNDNPIALFRKTLAESANTLAQGFREGVPVSTLVSLRAKLIDSLLERIWRRHLPKETSAALIAVGGYGRGELHPSSDVDIMLLVDRNNNQLFTGFCG